MMFVKICGLTNLEDALAAVEAGADAVGFNFWRPGSRYIEPGRAAEIAAALPEGLWKVGVFVDEEPGAVLRIARQVELTALQLHGSESPSYLEQLGAYKKFKAVRMNVAQTSVCAAQAEACATQGFDAARLSEYKSATAFLLDGAGATPGGTGQVFDWGSAIVAKKYGRVILAGGLTPENVAEAVRSALPWGVDVASGVESAPGRKDHRKVRAFVRAAREAGADCGLRNADCGFEENQREVKA